MDSTRVPDELSVVYWVCPKCEKPLKIDINDGADMNARLMILHYKNCKNDEN